MHYYISNDFLGDVWFNLINLIIKSGENIDNEYLEIRNLFINFHSASAHERYFISPEFQDNIIEMKKVFFSNNPNKFHHSYFNNFRNPWGNNDFNPIIKMLKDNPSTKKAILFIVGDGNGEVPCITSIQFFNRNNKIALFYTSRGQDIFKKFFADALCIYEIGNKISRKLELPFSGVFGAISSAHIYITDIPKIKEYTIGLQKNNIKINH